MPTISGFGSEWDGGRGQTKFWVEVDDGRQWAGYGDRLQAAQLHLRHQLKADAGLELTELGVYGGRIAGEIEDWDRLIARFPGGQAATPAFDYSRVM